MKLPGTYILDTEGIKLSAYRLLCLFYANREMARQSERAQHKSWMVVPSTLLSGTKNVGNLIPRFGLG